MSQIQQPRSNSQINALSESRQTPKLGLSFWLKLMLANGVVLGLCGYIGQVFLQERLLQHDRYIQDEIAENQAQLQKQQSQRELELRNWVRENQSDQLYIKSLNELMQGFAVSATKYFDNYEPGVRLDRKAEKQLDENLSRQLAVITAAASNFEASPDIQNTLDGYASAVGALRQVMSRMDREPKPQIFNRLVKDILVHHDATVRLVNKKAIPG